MAEPALQVLVFHREDDADFTLALVGFAESRALLSIAESTGGRCEAFFEAGPGRKPVAEEDRAELADWLHLRGVITAEVGELGKAVVYASPIR